VKGIARMSQITPDGIFNDGSLGFLPYAFVSGGCLVKTRRLGLFPSG